LKNEKNSIIGEDPNDTSSIQNLLPGGTQSSLTVKALIKKQEGLSIG